MKQVEVSNSNLFIIQQNSVIFSGSYILSHSLFHLCFIHVSLHSYGGGANFWGGSKQDEVSDCFTLLLTTEYNDQLVLFCIFFHDEPHSLHQDVGR